MMVSNIISIIAIAVSIISLLLTWICARHNLKIQLFQRRFASFSIIEEITDAVNNHLDILDSTNLSYLQNANCFFEMFVNNLAFEKVYALVRTEDYINYASQTYQELLRIQQDMRSITLVFKDDHYSKRAQAFVMAYIDFLKALYRHSVFVNRCKKCTANLSLLVPEAAVFQPREFEEFEKSLNKEKVAERIQNLLATYREFKEIPSLDALKKQITLSKP